MTGRLASLLLCLVVGLAPLALGSNRPLPWAYNAVLCGAFAIVAAAALIMAGQRYPPLRLGIITPSLILWGIAISWALMQVLPIAGSSLAHPNWTVLSQSLGEDIQGRISVNPHDTLASIVRLLTYGTLFISVFVLARDPGNASLLLRGFVVSAYLYAIYGLVRYATVSSKIFWFEMMPSGSLSSTFINRNSAATYFGIAACASLSLLIRKARHLLAKTSQDQTTRMKFDGFVRGLSGAFGLELAGFVLLFTSVLLSQSRAGVVATLAAFILCLLLQVLRLRTFASGAPTVIVFALIAGSLYGVLEASGAKVTERLMQTQMDTEGRVAVFHDTVRALSDHALMGTGLGTFQDIFPLYRTNLDPSELVWDKAHNDYLEILLGLGAPAGLAIILSLTVLASRCFRGFFQRQRNSHFSLAGFLASAIIAIHSFFDFSLQIQAVAMAFTLLLAVGTAQAVSDAR